MSHIEQEVLYAYLDGECEEDERLEVERHLASCQECSDGMLEARGLGVEAADLLAALEPGPVHAPPWHELERRAAERRLGRGGSTTAGALDEVGAAGVGSTPKPPPLWRRPALAWAATLILAFGLGWLTSSGQISELLLPERAGFEEIDTPVDLSESNPFEAGSVESAAGEMSPREVPEEEARSERAPQSAPAAPAAPVEGPERRDADTQAGVAEALAEEGGAQAGARQEQVTDELQTVAEEATRKVAAPTVPSEAEPPPAVADPKVTEQEEGRAAIGEALARRQRQAAAGGELRASEVAQQNLPQERAAALTAADAPMSDVAGIFAAREGGSETDLATAYRRLVERYGPAGSGGEVAAVGFLSVSPESAEVWLGAPLRRLEELTLVGVEVGPGGALEGSIRGLPLIILKYEDAAGQRVVLLQQYLQGAALAGPGMVAAPRREAPREPALIVSPDGVRAYRWLDVEGYLLTVMGTLHSDALRGLVDEVQ